MMMFEVPCARGLVKPAQPQHRIGNELVAHLEALQVVLLRRYIKFAEDAKLVVRQPKNQVGVEPRIVVARVRLARARERLGGHENLEFAGRGLVLSERRGACKGRQKRGQGGAAPRSRHSRSFHLAHVIPDVYFEYSRTIARLS